MKRPWIVFLSILKHGPIIRSVVASKRRFWATTIHEIAFPAPPELLPEYMRMALAMDTL
jgi:hypothetical protein